MPPADGRAAELQWHRSCSATSAGRGRADVQTFRRRAPERASRAPPAPSRDGLRGLSRRVVVGLLSLRQLGRSPSRPGRRRLSSGRCADRDRARRSSPAPPLWARCTCCWKKASEQVAVVPKGGSWAWSPAFRPARAADQKSPPRRSLLGVRDPGRAASRRRYQSRVAPTYLARPVARCPCSRSSRRCRWSLAWMN